MDNETRTNFTWQQKHQEKIKPILGAALGHEIFTQSTFHYDAVYGVDLILIPDNFSTAHRLRRSSSALDYWPNCTIRGLTNYGISKTEIHKLLEDEKVRYGFYGIVSDVGDQPITHAVVYNLVKFRQFFRQLPLLIPFNKMPYRVEEYCRERGVGCEFRINKDKKSGLLDFNIDEFNSVVPGFIVKKYQPENLVDTDLREWLDSLKFGKA